ncbi:glycoside hydrolase family 3 protein [Herbiconiux daphne]|uniref:beta-glucosidase n=1 Tax=Herbiconiux daphne TaxID=2970914 RepID=A0ABT2H6Y2_9MICO|nr:glycoside hydrolase family 3 N-terminal domain-containing protein [Herbiconiux daphne]MCS5735703.1 glycoside hydrolase family 3 C-terminal domain-containing protein [Herbiconiux daphne]
MISTTPRQPKPRRVGLAVAGAVLAPLAAVATFASPAYAADQPELGTRTADILTVDGLQFRDLDSSGDLTPYEDWRLTSDERAADLVGHLTLEQKAGLLMHASLSGQGAYDKASFSGFLQNGHITTYISRLGVGAATLATEHNALQELAEAEPLGIPLLISTDPRSGFTVTEGQTVSNGDFTPFPDAIGMGATADPELTYQMGDIIRQEYAAVGIREALSPQADIATEPRWTRINGTFGSVGVDVKPFVKAYVEALQGGTQGLTESSVATVVKHWVGYGAQENGYDSHYYYGRYAVFPGNNFAEHITPYEGAFEAGAAGIMPTYSILKNLEVDGTEIEQVGAGHNEYLLQDLLREQYGFDGVITSDWAIANDCPQVCRDTRPPAPFFGSWGAGMPWGVEDLTLPERYASAINAGVDILGGSDQPQYIVQAVQQGYLSNERLDEAAGRVLAQKFDLGLFENPYVDPAAADALVGNAEFRAVGLEAQERSLTLLENENNVLPLKAGAGTKVFLYGVTDEAALAAGLTPVTDVTQADVAIVRLTDPRGGADLTDLTITGSEEDATALAQAHAAGVTTIAVPQLSRPLILDKVLDSSDAVLGAYGVSDEALLNVIIGAAEPEGVLPFELPSTMEEVEAQYADVPNDTANPLFEYGFGLRYAAAPVTNPEPTPLPKPGRDESPVAGDGTLAATGAEITGTILAAVILLGAGAALVIRRRRRSA